LLSIVGLVLLARVDATGSYWSGLLPGLLLFGVGITAVGVPNQIAAIADVGHGEAGAASGLINAGYQVGGALGLAIITTFSTSHVTAQLAAGASQSDALVAGFHRGLLIAAAFAAVNLLASIPAPRLKPDAEQLLEAAAAA
jgi:hypothetical protein